MKVHNTYKKLMVIILLVSLSLIVVTTSLLVQNQKNSSKAQAASNTPEKCNCNDPNYCYPDGCSGKPMTSDNRYDDDRYKKACGSIDFGWPPDIEVQKYFCSIKQPASCFDVYKYKDDRLACFMERWFCHPSLCAGSSGNGDCGKYWRLPEGFTGYGCVKGPDNNNLSLVWGNLPPNLPNGQAQQPTTTPIIPTQLPTEIPTAIPTEKPNQPTSTPAPTSSPIPTNQQPTNVADIDPSYNSPPPNPPIPTNTPYKFPTIEIKSPKELAREVINPENIQKLERSTEKVLDAPKEGLDMIKKADQILERTANSWITRIQIFIENLMD